MAKDKSNKKVASAPAPEQAADTTPDYRKPQTISKKDEFAVKTGIGFKSKQDREADKKDAERAEGRKRSQNIASVKVTGKHPEEEEEKEKKPSRYEIERARSMRRKRIAVGIVSAVLIIAFCLPAASYLISGAKGGNKGEEEQAVNRQDELIEQIDTYKAELEADPSAVENYKKLGALYADWAEAIVEGEITDTEYSVEGRYKKAIEAYKTYIAKDADGVKAYKTLAALYSTWAGYVANGTIADSDYSAGSLYKKSIAAYQSLYDVTGKASVFANMAETYTTWAQGVVGGSVSGGNAGELLQKAVDSYKAYAAEGDDVDVSSQLAGIYDYWAGQVENGTISGGGKSAAQLWKLAMDNYEKYLGTFEEGSAEWLQVKLALLGAQFDSGSESKALEGLQELADANPTDINVWSTLASYLTAHGDNEKARAAYQSMIDNNPKSPYGYYYYGYELYNDGEFEAAIDIFKKGIKADRKDTQGLKGTFEMLISLCESSLDVEKQAAEAAESGDAGSESAQ